MPGGSAGGGVAGTKGVVGAKGAVGGVVTTPPCPKVAPAGGAPCCASIVGGRTRWASVAAGAKHDTTITVSPIVFRENCTIGLKFGKETDEN